MSSSAWTSLFPSHGGSRRNGVRHRSKNFGILSRSAARIGCEVAGIRSGEGVEGASLIYANTSGIRSVAHPKRRVRTQRASSRSAAPGAVGTGSIRGMPHLARLRTEGFSIWPFHEARPPLVLEIYPRLLTGDVIKADFDAREAYLAKAECPEIDDSLACKVMHSEDAFDAAVSAVVMSRHLDEILRAHYERRSNGPHRGMYLVAPGGMNEPRAQVGGLLDGTVTRCGAEAPRSRR